MNIQRPRESGLTIEQAAIAISKDGLTSLALVEQALERIACPGGEGSRTFTHTFPAQARAVAAAADRLRAERVPLSLLAGMPVSVKDLFDVVGRATTAGSSVLAGAPPPARDAAVVARLRAAGAAVIGTTNMTELAFGGLGLNPHYGTPRNPFERAIGRIPGGSSSGAAVSVADGMSIAAIGSDTAGSVRIPAALCGVVGFKPTRSRVPLDGIWPLAPSLDSIGPLTRSVACAAIVDGVLSAAAFEPLTPARLQGLRLGIPATTMLDDLDPHVARSFEQTVSRLGSAGASIVSFDFPELIDIAGANAKGSFSVIEGHAVNRHLIESGLDKLDPMTAPRWRLAERCSAADYFDLLRARETIMACADRTLSDFDAVICPTVPIVAPPISQFDRIETCTAANQQLIRNTGVANFLDLCALTLPCHEAGTAPVGFMLTGRRLDDRNLLGIGLAIESLLAPHREPS